MTPNDQSAERRHLRWSLAALLAVMSIAAGTASSIALRARYFEFGFSGLGLAVSFLVSWLAGLPFALLAARLIRARWFSFAAGLAMIFALAIGLRATQPLRVAALTHRPHLRVGYLVDPRLPMMQPAEVREAFAFASQTVARELALRPPELELASTAELLPEAFHRGEIANTIERVNPLSDEGGGSSVKAKMAAHAHGLRELEYDGAPVLTAQSLPYMTRSGWHRHFIHQTTYDVVVTNVPIFDDMVDQQSEHILAGAGLVGGLGNIYSPQAPWGPRATLLSTFGFANLEPYAYHVDAARAAEVFGTVLIAHELGHTLLALPDNDDHGPLCLMFVVPDEDKLAALEALRSDAAPCPRCARSRNEGARWLIRFWP